MNQFKCKSLSINQELQRREEEQIAIRIEHTSHIDFSPQFGQASNACPCCCVLEDEGCSQPYLNTCLLTRISAGWSLLHLYKVDGSYNSKTQQQREEEHKQEHKHRNNTERTTVQARSSNTTLSHRIVHLNRFGVALRCEGVMCMLLSDLVFCRGRDGGLFISPRHQMSIEPSIKYLQKFCSWVVHRIGPIWCTTGPSIATAPPRIMTGPSLSGWHRTAMCHPTVELIIMCQVAIGAKVMCATGPSTIDNPVIFIIKILRRWSS